MGQVSGTYTEKSSYSGAGISFYSTTSTGDGQSLEGGGSVSGSGTWSYTIYYTENGFTDTTWQGGYPYGAIYTAEQVESMTKEDQYLLAQSLAGMGLNSRGCVTVTQIS